MRCLAGESDSASGLEILLSHLTSGNDETTPYQWQ